MREFLREGTGIRFGKTMGMGINMSSNGNENGNVNWYTVMGGNGNDKPIPAHL